ncbi:dTDP-4-dehydrorhamnose reductase [Maribacter halichondriae]|uniref:dTDP-4-dehydrorhamnose reductase n=1 Tax=Maribacter halichondriae TaxID=2980554 RepID=UPI002358994E|nr:dTDP-4-dehydrorhamnose reductase [Maribacter sp. Hal144]
MKKVLVTGGNGQLASCIKDIDKTAEAYEFIYVDLPELDITDNAQVRGFFNANELSYCVNCAAYTAVDNAESEQQLATSVNVLGAKNLAEACKAYGAVMFQISTDFVFDGRQGQVYAENDPTNPLGVYGLTKLQGEQAVADTLKAHFILRTSWLYSEHGHNFVKTMLRLGAERDTLNVVGDQIGTPTYAGDLAHLILQLISQESDGYGTYHYSNEGVASWYDFAKAIFDLAKLDCNVLPILTEAYPTPAKRPAFSVMDKSKIKDKYRVQIPYWRESLGRVIQKLI